MEIKGKVVLLTGASMGIGKATAELLASRGARVALAARSAGKLEELAKRLPGSKAVPADMTRPDEVKRMMATTHAAFGRLDVLVNNAGQGMYAPIESTDIPDLARLMELNLYGPIIAMQAAIPLMRAQGGGAIVNVSSMVTRAAYPAIGPYAATKAALNLISATARNELAKDGIVVSLVLPGLTDTDFRKNAVPARVPFARPNLQMPQADPPELVAQKILEAIESGAAEIALMH
jgi:short-subunit dehydrogenase